jgi:hypothetical protein
MPEAFPRSASTKPALVDHTFLEKERQCRGLAGVLEAKALRIRFHIGPSPRGLAEECSDLRFRRPLKKDARMEVQWRVSEDAHGSPRLGQLGSEAGMNYPTEADDVD